MTTLFQKQSEVVQRYDSAIASLRKAIVKKGQRPVAVLVTDALGDGIQAALRRRKQIHRALYDQWNNLMKGEIAK